MKYSPVRHWTSVTDRDATVLGIWSGSGLPALAVKRFPGGGTLIYSAQAGGVTPRFLANVAREAGAHLYTAPGNSVAVGCGIAAVHRLAEPVILEFPVEMEFFDSQTGEPCGIGRRLELNSIKPRESRVVLYRRKASTESPKGTEK
ncbi:hypothetical protein SDC9_137245 [bioreactor metagenome]|uniref:Uncharacterized protein n=1 Tax=bioreactor metagenome TaxID=1076179 RepID=A0A645DM23_9ZZZZ